MVGRTKRRATNSSTTDEPRMPSRAPSIDRPAATREMTSTMRTVHREAATMAREVYAPVPTRIWRCAWESMKSGTSSARMRRYRASDGSCMSDAIGAATIQSTSAPATPLAPKRRSTAAPAGRQSSASATSFTEARAKSAVSVHSNHTTIAVESVRRP
jgi:hypothetical protein